MPKRSSKRDKKDINVIAANIVKQTTNEPIPKPFKEDQNKNPAAVALGRLGGKKGGKARAEKLSPERRKEIAKKAAEARWMAKSSIH
jgi:hypothetical protein